MKVVRMMVLASIVGLAVGTAWAQAGAGGKGPGPGPQAASAPGMGMGMGMGPGAGGGRGPGARWGTDSTPGWALMTEQERNEHRQRMGAMKTYDECKAYQTQQHELMAARAKERGGKVLAQPRRDACAGLKR